MILARYRHPPDVRRALRALAAVTCPPEAESLELLDDIVDHVELSMRSLPAAVRTALVTGVRTYELAALAVPAHRGRRASQLDRERAAAYYARWRRGTRIQREFAKGVKGLLCLAHFEMPAVLARIGYTPDAWIAKVAQRRMDRYADDVERHERSLLAPDPLSPRPARAAGRHTDREAP